MLSFCSIAFKARQTMSAESLLELMQSASLALRVLDAAAGDVEVF